MADETTLSVATYEQIATLLSKLAVNYSNMASKFFDIFYSTTAQDISLQLYDASGTLQTYTIPNRAKDFTYILNGSGTPEGTKTANVGSIYQDTTNGKLYVKELGTGVTGWVQIYAGEEILHGSGSPEGVVIATVGKMYVDDTNGALYIKTTSSVSQAEGWTLISANTGALADKDLSNLSTTGEAHFANPSLSNLDTTGTALFAAKEDVSNKITTIQSTSTDTEYPSAKATYTYAEGVRSDRADKDLSNLNTTGNYKILPSHTGNSGKALVSNGVNGVWTDLTTQYDSRYVNISGDTMTGPLSVTSPFTVLGQGSGREGGQINFQAAPNEATTNEMYIDRYDGKFRVVGVSSYGNINILLEANAQTGWVSLNNGNPTIIAHYLSGASGYRIWSDGYCVQWGRMSSGTQTSFMKVFSDTNYSLVANALDPRESCDGCTLTNLTTSSFNCIVAGHGGSHWVDNGTTVFWRACGYLASGQY